MKICWNSHPTTILCMHFLRVFGSFTTSVVVRIVILNVTGLRVQNDRSRNPTIHVLSEAQSPNKTLTRFLLDSLRRALMASGRPPMLAVTNLASLRISVTFCRPSLRTFQFLSVIIVRSSSVIRSLQAVMTASCACVCAWAQCTVGRSGTRQWSPERPVTKNYLHMSTCR